MTDNRQFDVVNQQVDELKDVMKDNIGKVIDRGEKLEDLESKANDLEQNVSIPSFVVARDGKKWLMTTTMTTATTTTVFR